MAWVSTAVASPAAMEQRISLYLGLKPGAKADFEVVGRAAAAFAEVVKEVAFILEPGLEVKLEFESGTEGSLSLNAVLKAKKRSKKDGDEDGGGNARLIAIIFCIAAWFTNDIRTYGVTKLLDTYLAPEQKSQLSDDDIERIVKRISEGKIAKEPVQQVYKELERDDAIESVGTVTKPGTKPTAPVQRSQFPDLAGILPAPQVEPRRRKIKGRERLTLISPVLLESGRVWRLKNSSGEFGYAMKDEAFLRAVLSGRRKIPMKEGIQLSAKIETIEEKEGDVWVIKERHIIEVERIIRARETGDLFPKPKPAAKKKKSAKKKKAKS